MVTPIAELKRLYLKYLLSGCNFSKLPMVLKKPMLVKVFKTEPFFFIQDKENYCIGYFSAKAKKKLSKEYDNPSAQLRGQTLKISKFSLQVAYVDENEYNPTSYLNREIKFIIEDFSISRPLKKGKDVNRFVVNMGKDEHFQLAMAHFIHQSKVKAGEKITLDEFLKNEAHFSPGTAYSSFKSVLYGDNPMPKVTMDPRVSKDDRFKLSQLVTCIIDPVYDTKILNKGIKRRIVKKEFKQEAIKEAEDEVKELQRLKEDKDNISKASNKSSRTKRKSKKSQSKVKTTKREEIVPTPKKVKVENDFLAQIEKILEYSKKSKSSSDMDFSATDGKVEGKKINSPKSIRKPKKLSRFKEYLEWYDFKTKAAKASVFSKAPSTTLTTPVKASLRISERLARAQRMR